MGKQVIIPIAEKYARDEVAKHDLYKLRDVKLNELGIKPGRARTSDAAEEFTPMPPVPCEETTRELAMKKGRRRQH